MCQFPFLSFFFFNDTATTEIYTLSLHDALPISFQGVRKIDLSVPRSQVAPVQGANFFKMRFERLKAHLEKVRSEEHTSELQSPDHLVCRLLLEKKKNKSRPSNMYVDSRRLIKNK